MASAFSHAVAALSLGLASTDRRCLSAFGSRVRCARFAGYRCDRLSFWYSLWRFLGSSRFTHSLLFAGLVSGTAAALLVRRGMTAMSDFALFAYLFLATASHGVLDAMTKGGLGVAFSPHSITPGISCRGDRFAFRRYRLRASSLIEDISCSEVNWCGFGFRHFYLRRLF
jgi:hypothetical protein